MYLRVSWDVDDENGENSFKDESKVEDVIVEGFLDHGVLPRPHLYGRHPLDQMLRTQGFEVS